MNRPLWKEQLLLGLVYLGLIAVSSCAFVLIYLVLSQLFPVDGVEYCPLMIPVLVFCLVATWFIWFTSQNWLLCLRQLLRIATRRELTDEEFRAQFSTEIADSAVLVRELLVKYVKRPELTGRLFPGDVVGDVASLGEDWLDFLDDVEAQFGVAKVSLRCTIQELASILARNKDNLLSVPETPAQTRKRRKKLSARKHARRNKKRK